MAINNFRATQDNSDYQFSLINETQLGYVYTGSDMFRSVWDPIHSGTDPLSLQGTGSKLEQYGST